MIGERTYIMETIAVSNEKYLLCVPLPPLTQEISKTDSVEDGSGNEGIKKEEIPKSALNEISNQENKPEDNRFTSGNMSQGTKNNDINESVSDEILNQETANNQLASGSDSPDTKNDVINKSRSEEILNQENKREGDLFATDKGSQAIKNEINKSISNKILNEEKIIEDNQFASDNGSLDTKNDGIKQSVSDDILNQEKKMEDNQFSSGNGSQDTKNGGITKSAFDEILNREKKTPVPEVPAKETNLATTKVSERNPIRNFHPLFISADGKVHELLLRHRKVMQLTKPSPYERFQKCMDLRRYFGGLPRNYECEKHKEENRVPLWIQRYLYEYRRFVKLFQTGQDEEDSLKRLIKPRPAKQSKPKEKGKKAPRLAKVCRLCGQKCERFVCSGHNVVIKLVSVYLPLVITEGHAFPLGLCDKCDYSLALICSFMLTYLDCAQMEKDEKKCFACGCAIENLLTTADVITMQKLASAFHGIRFGLREFLGRGQKYLCSACRLSFELLESFREHIWITNKVFQDGDERLYEMEGEVVKNQFTCELPPGFYSPPNKINKKFGNSVDNCSVLPVTDPESYYMDDYEPRKYFLKRRHRHMIMKLFRRLRRSQSTENKSKSVPQLQKAERMHEEVGKRGIFSALKRRLTLPLKPLKKLFHSGPTGNVNTKCSENQNYNKYELLTTSSTDSMVEDHPLSLNVLSNDEIETAAKPISKYGIFERLEDSEYDTADENEPSLLKFYLGNMDTSLFEYFNADVVLSPDILNMQSNTEEPQPSTSQTNAVQTVAEVHQTSKYAEIPSTSKEHSTKP